MKISVIGCGYLGAVHAAAMASLGHEVVGVDVDADKVAALTSGRPPFFEPGLSELLVKGQNLGSLEFTTDVSRVADSRIHFVCVGTPQKPGEFAADVTYVDAAANSLIPYLTSTSVVVGKSTVPVGTAERLAALLAPAGATLMWNPEFLREGHAVEDTLHPNRLVYGVADGQAGEQATAGLDEVYATMLAEETPRMITDFATAELVKTAANSFLATKISFINAMAELCEASGADVTQLADAIGMDDRIGRKFLNAGLGFGGGCLPKDIRAFMARAGELGADQAVAFLREIDSINMRRRVRMVDIARDTLDGSFIGKKVTVLGAAFKPNSDDVRDSPALAVARLIATQGGVVTVTDPQAIDNAAKTFPELNYVADTSQALAGADAVLLLTEWQEYRDLDPVATASLVADKLLIDGRNVLTPQVWRAAGWTYRALGRP
ncbi:UDPglucose 6-dehydrogenase [Brevibacterium sp. 239c]|uniref:UDP-glucose dehydrogenase family protein n=1 Tax=Brevibacterium sp. 239c TaxID=1965356 RepID=UPI000C4EDD4F|nr:UDP-glucose/GDP-mannose dehydrogenase family protein [Brevibacterium sp. 239c]SMX74937.1 UDPglucose 6-dehydrogenase [Brevibacterium sp. 239c]